MSADHLSGGFATPAQDSARAFRAIMTAMARPGTILEVTGAQGPAPLSAAASVVLATLTDPDTGVWLAPSCDTTESHAWLAFHCGAPRVAPDAAQFALGRWEEFDLDAFAKGTPIYPDRSTTLIVEMEHLSAEGATLTGPGIETTAQLSLPETAAFQANRALFPRGLDFILTCGTRLAALPRSTEVR